MFQRLQRIREHISTRRDGQESRGSPARQRCAGGGGAEEYEEAREGGRFLIQFIYMHTCMCAVHDGFMSPAMLIRMIYLVLY